MNQKVSCLHTTEKVVKWHHTPSKILTRLCSCASLPTNSQKQPHICSHWRVNINMLCTAHYYHWTKKYYWVDEWLDEWVTLSCVHRRGFRFGCAYVTSQPLALWTWWQLGIVIIAYRRHLITPLGGVSPFKDLIQISWHYSIPVFFGGHPEFLTNLGCSISSWTSKINSSFDVAVNFLGKKRNV